MADRRAQETAAVEEAMPERATQQPDVGGVLSGHLVLLADVDDVGTVALHFARHTRSALHWPISRRPGGLDSSKSVRWKTRLPCVAWRKQRRRIGARIPSADTGSAVPSGAAKDSHCQHSLV